MDVIIVFVLLGFLILAFWARIKLFRPHWLGNILFFITVCVIGIMGGDTGDTTLSIAISFSIITHIWAKAVDKKKAKKAAATPPNPAVTQKPVTPPKATTPPKTTTPPKPVTPPKETTPPKTDTTPKPTTTAKPVTVPQTLTTCVRCARPLKGPKCSHCGFDHIANPVWLLCLMPPQKLQIQPDADKQTNA